MSDTSAHLLYLEPDDEITTVVRRLRESDAPRVVLVASGRSKATSSSVGLRLLAQVAAEEGREIAIVADPAARALAAEAGIDAFASIAEAAAEAPTPSEPQPVRRASIKVVRDLPERLGDAPLPISRPRGRGADETQSVVPARPPTVSRTSRGSARRGMRPVVGALLAVLLVVAAALAAVLPAASVTIVPATMQVGPRTYILEPPVQGPDTATLRSTKEGTATGERVEEIPATGTVTFFNWNGPNTPIEVPAGTVVSGDGASFTTDADIVVPGGHFAGGPIESGEADVTVTAVDGGPNGNLAARAIDTVESASVTAALSGTFGILPVVRNSSPTAGGDEARHAVIAQRDVAAVVAAIHEELGTQVAARLAADPTRVYPAMSFDPPLVDVPGDLVGTEDIATFELSAAYAFSRTYVTVADIEDAARDAFDADVEAVPEGMTSLPDTVAVEIGTARAVAERIRVDVTVTARAAAEVDTDAIRVRILGQTREDAQESLSTLGTVRVELWPGWVDRIPRLDWRVEVEVLAE